MSEQPVKTAQTMPLPAPATANEPNRISSVLFVFVLSILAFMPYLGSYGIIDPSDGLYAEGAREMVESGDYVTPHFNYAPFYEKPVLVYWLIAASYKLLGISEFAARLPSALSAVLVTIYIYLVCRKYLGHQTALFSSLLLLSNGLFLIVGRLALTDMPLTTAGNLGILLLFETQRSGKRLTAVAAYACFAATVLLKGPVLLILAMASVALNKVVVSSFDEKERTESWYAYFQKFKPITGLLSLTVLTLPWLVIENTTSHGAFFTEFIVRQNLGRLGGAVNHSESWWFYIPILIAIFLPWSLVLPFVAFRTRRYIKIKFAPTVEFRFLAMVLSWVAVNYAVFTMIKTKLPTYILPAIPLSCVCIGHLVHRLSDNLQVRETLKIATHLNLQRLLPVYLLASSSVMMALSPVALLYYYSGKHADIKRIVDEATCNSQLATFWRDTTSGVFYHRKHIDLILEREALEKFRLSPGKLHKIIVTTDLIPFFKYEMRDPNVVPVKTAGSFNLYNLD